VRARARTLFQPGRSAHPLATQRERACRTIVAGALAAGAPATGAPISTASTGGDAPATASGGGTGTGAAAHALSTPRIAACHAPRRCTIDRYLMWIILLEALAALLVLVGIVWWVMFSGRSRGERRRDPGA
jgi:hypothetical protein